MHEVQDLAGMSVGLGTVIGLLSGTVAAVGVWFRLKGVVKILTIELENIKNSMGESKTTYNNDKSIIHDRLDHHRIAIDDNKEKSDTGLADMKQFINEMKVEIIREIHSKLG